MFVRSAESTFWKIFIWFWANQNDNWMKGKAVIGAIVKVEKFFHVSMRNSRESIKVQLHKNFWHCQSFFWLIHVFNLWFHNLWRKQNLFWMIEKVRIKTSLGASWNKFLTCHKWRKENNHAADYGSNRLFVCFVVSYSCLYFPL